MMHRKWLVAAAAAVLVLVGSALGAGAQEAKGSIKGSVKNLTSGGGSVTGLEASLLVFTSQNQSVKQTAKVDDQGKFAFEGLDTGSDFTYLVHIKYQGVDYGSEPLTFPADKKELAVEMPCFDATTAAEAVSSPARHYLLDPDPEGVDVTEIVILRNATDKTYVGSKEIQQGIRETLRFSVPEGAKDLAYGDGMTASQIVPVEGGFADTWPIYPGDTQRVFRYRIPAKGGSVSFTSKITMPAEKVSVLAPDIGTNISVSSLSERSNPTVQGDKFVLLSGQNLPADTELKFKVDRLPSAQVSAVGPLALAGGVGVVLLAMVGLVLFVRSRRRSKAPAKPVAAARPATAPAAAAESAGPSAQEKPAAVEAEPAESEADRLDAEKRELIAAIARLDDQFEKQQIGAEEYNRLRGEQKRRLVEVVERQKALAAEEGQ